MKTNLEKWNYAKGILDKEANLFMDTISHLIPVKFYLVRPTGNIDECTVINRHYSFHLWFTGNKPTNKDVAEIYAVLNGERSFDIDKAYFDYSYLWNYGGQQHEARTAIKVKDVFENKAAFLSKGEAEKAAAIVKEKFESDRRFDEKHKKDANYDYSKNGYKFLGWQNSWKHVYFDEDGNETTGDTSKGEKPKKSFGYRKQDYPEHGACVEQKHRTITVHHDRRGIENTVSCPLCRIYWKYDSSD